MFILIAIHHLPIYVSVIKENSKQIVLSVDIMNVIQLIHHIHHCQKQFNSLCCINEE